MVMGKLPIVPWLLLLVAFGAHGVRPRLLKRDACGMPKVLACLTEYVGVFDSGKSVLATNDAANITEVHCRADEVSDRAVSSYSPTLRRIVVIQHKFISFTPKSHQFQIFPAV